VLSREHLLARVLVTRYEGGPRTVDIHGASRRTSWATTYDSKRCRGSGYKFARARSREKAAREDEATKKTKKIGRELNPTRVSAEAARRWLKMFFFFSAT